MPLDTASKWLRANTDVRQLGVDREKKMIHGFVVAQEGPFKSQGRGEFDRKSLRSIIQLMKSNKAGTKAHLGHATLSDDGVGKILGRAKNPFLDVVHVGDKEVQAVRADLHFVDSAFDTPGGDLATYVMDLAEQDSDLLSSSLVLAVDEEFRLDAKGRRKTDDEGRDLPPLWRPTAIHATDIVDTGDAVDGLLSPDDMRDEAVRKGAELLDRVFAGASRRVVEARATAWLQKYLELRFGDELAREREAEAIRLQSEIDSELAVS